MNKKFFIIGGLAVILLLLSIWAYLLVYGSPSSENGMFANLGTEGEIEEGSANLPPVVVEEQPVVDIVAGRLRQLTTGPVAGFKEVMLSTSTPALLYYVEMGTGHVYTIDTENGETVRVSATTFPQTITAEISDNGRYYAFLGASATKSSPLTVGTLATSTVSITTSLEGSASDVAFNEQNRLYVLSRSDDRSNATVYNPANDTTTPLFTLPFLEATVSWGDGEGDSHLIYPKPASSLEGQVYEVTGGKLTRLPIDGLGLTALRSGEVVHYNTIENNRLQSYFYIESVDMSSPLDSVVLVEKCLNMANDGVFICAQDASKTDLRNQEDWYTGEVSFSDSVWLLDGNTLTGELLFDAYEESGRELDIVKLDINDTGTVLYFINKLDNTLWMYEL